MDDLKQKVKSKVLDEIMSLMDEKMMEPMKAKSPKFKAMEVDIEAKPLDEDELKEKLEEEPSVLSDGDEPKMEMDDSEPSEEEKEQIRRLYEKYCK